MDPQLLMPSPAADFNFDSTSSSPYTTAPSSPNILFPKFFYSTPTSPTRPSISFHDLSPFNPDAAEDFQSADPFASCAVNHEQKNDDFEVDGMDFAFDFSGQLERPSISDADELFDGGKIKPLEQPPPSRLSNETRRSVTFVPRSNGNINLESFSEALHQIPKDQIQNPSPRGRERTAATTRHKASRSLSPLRISDAISDDQKVSTTQPSSQFGFTWYNKWNLKNLLLFRSTSEGSAATSNDRSKKYGMITKGDQDVKNSSFRSNDGGGSVGGSSRKMKRKMSAHEIHYTANRAVTEGMRRKTFLPYKSGLLGCLGFSNNLHEYSRGR